jgi:hypothetical protein
VYMFPDTYAKFHKSSKLLNTFCQDFTGGKKNPRLMFESLAGLNNS